MATAYTLVGVKTARDLEDNLASVTDTRITLIFPDGSPASLSYEFQTPDNPVPDPDDEDLPLVDFDDSSWLSAELAGFDLDMIMETYQGFVNWDGSTTQVAAFWHGPAGEPATDWYFTIGGSTLPDFTAAADPVAAFEAFEATITGAGHNPDGPFGPGTDIPLASMPGIIVSGNIIENTSAGDDTVTGTADGDHITSEGSGEHVINSLAGDDVIVLSAGVNYVLDAGAGSDVVDFSALAGTENWADLQHAGLSGGVTADINGETNVGRISKPGGETTVLIDPKAVMEADGLAVFGTGSADTFNVTVAENGWLGLQGGAGDDSFNIGANSGLLRLDYSDAAGGIVADLAAGSVEDGDGGTDSLAGAGHVSELRGSMHGDDITGSDQNESFILMAGDDTLDGGAGTDTLRYDRTGTGAVTADLAAGTATGTWDGEAFSHSFTGIENLNGSREGADLLRGNGGQNALWGSGGNDTLEGGAGDDTLEGDDGDDVIDGGSGLDQAAFRGIDFADAEFSKTADGAIQVVSALGTDTLTNIEEFVFDDGTFSLDDALPGEDWPTVGSSGGDTLTGGDGADEVITGGGDDKVSGGGGNDTLDGGTGNDTLRGDAGDDSIDGGDGSDTLNGGDGADTITGGSSPDDLRDVIFGGDGDDFLVGGAGNDQIFGMGGNDTIAGGFGVDELQGQEGNDVITGSAFSDLVFGGTGEDFVNGGFGHDRINGGADADKFYHLGVFDHGSDWVQDYSSAEGDVLLFGQAGASADDFQVNFAHTANAEGERSGDDSVEEAFVIYKPTGQIIWALVDGGGEAEINLEIAGTDGVFDLLA